MRLSKPQPAVTEHTVILSREVYEELQLDRARLDWLEKWLAESRDVRFLRIEEDGCWIVGTPADFDNDVRCATVRQVIDYDAGHKGGERCQ